MPHYLYTGQLLSPAFLEQKTLQSVLKRGQCVQMLYKTGGG